MGCAWVRVDAKLLAEALGLPAGAEIIRADMNSCEFSLRLGISDPSLRDADPQVVAPEISMIFHQEEIDGIRRVYAEYSSVPGVRWLVFERLIRQEAPSTAVLEGEG